MSEVREAPIRSEASEPVVRRVVPKVEPVVVVAPAKRRRWVRPLLFLLLPLALLAGGYEYVVGGSVMSTENAYVRADIVAVSTDISGMVKEIDVRDNQVVKAGDVLFKLDDLPFRLALEKADAQVAIVAATLDALKASYRDMQAQIQQSQFDVDFYVKQMDRQQRLVATNATSVVSLEQAQREAMAARHRLGSQQQQLAGIVANLAGNPEIAIADHPRSREAVAQRDEAARQLAHTVVVAPMDGVVTNVPSLQPGQYLSAAMAAFSIVATDHMWIDANPKETELTYVRPGQDVTVSVDTYPDQAWHGTVESISPASSSSFAMLPAQNTSGNWVKVVQRIPMRVRIETAEGQPPLRAGMSVVIGVNTGRARGLPTFLSGGSVGNGVAEAAFVRVANRGAITACVILAVIMQALDTTIANVALPYIQGSVSASQDQINWVLTSYIVAAAIMTPPSGWLAARFGRKRVLLASIAGFVFASILCGLAQSLVQIVGFRLMQGFFGAALVPLSQSILLDIYTPAERGGAMALFGVSVMVGPVLGPVIGGWLTENIDWRWVFYINLPLGVLAFAGVTMFVTETNVDRGRRLDWMGFGTLSVAIAALQLCLDRGEQLDWFGSGEVMIEGIVAASAFYLFLVHIFTAERPFVNPSLFKDRNFAVGMLFIFVVGITYLASLALMTPYLQTLMGYPVVTAGIVMGPRGMGTMVCMFLVGRLIGKVDIRALLAIGLGLTAWAMYDMTGWTPDVSQWTIVSTGFIQGAGLGFLFVPLTTVTFSTLPAEKRGDGTGLYNLSRNIGSAVGISAVSALLTQNTQINHAEIGAHVTAFNRILQQFVQSKVLDTVSVAGRGVLDEMVTTQATVIAYVDDFKLMMLLCIGAIPLLLLLRKARGPSAAPDHAVVME